MCRPCKQINQSKRCEGLLLEQFTKLIEYVGPILYTGNCIQNGDKKIQYFFSLVSLRNTQLSCNFKKEKKTG